MLVHTDFETAPEVVEETEFLKHLPGHAGTEDERVEGDESRHAAGSKVKKVRGEHGPGGEGEGVGDVPAVLVKGYPDRHSAVGREDLSHLVPDGLGVVEGLGLVVRPGGVPGVGGSWAASGWGGGSESGCWGIVGGAGGPGGVGVGRGHDGGVRGVGGGAGEGLGGGIGDVHHAAGSKRLVGSPETTREATYVKQYP